MSFSSAAIRVVHQPFYATLDMQACRFVARLLARFLLHALTQSVSHGRYRPSAVTAVFTVCVGEGLYVLLCCCCFHSHDVVVLERTAHTHDVSSACCCVSLLSLQPPVSGASPSLLNTSGGVTGGGAGGMSLFQGLNITDASPQAKQQEPAG